MSVNGIHAKPRPNSPASTSRQYVPVVVGALLFLLLCFTTATVFVRGAWALQAFQIGIFALVAAYLLVDLQRKDRFGSGHPAVWLVYLIPLWGVVQIIAHTTSSTFETRKEVLRWAALAGVFFLSQVIARSGAARRIILNAMLFFATAMAVLSLMQMFTSDGQVLWIFSTGYPDVYGTFPNHSNYAQFAELALPIALWRALREGWRSWWYSLAGGVIYASVIGSASRAGTLLCTAELLAMLIIGLLTQRRQKTSQRSRQATAILLLIPVFAALFTFAVGWQHVWERFGTKDPFSGRWEFLVAATHMAHHRPLTGFGLGTFPEVYQRFAVKDFPFYANHAHNDWAEFAADGGIPFLLLVFIPFAVAIPTAIRHPWGIGLIAVMVHACVDFPFPRPAVSGWMFALLAVLYMKRQSDKNRRQSVARSSIADTPAA